MYDSGEYSVIITRGGSSVTVLNDNTPTCRYYKVGQLVFISCAFWSFTVINPSNDIFTMKIPFTAKSVRNIGQMGYNNSGKDILPIIAADNNMGFIIKYPDGHTADIKGNEIPSCEIQFSILYATDANQSIAI